MLRKAEGLVVDELILDLEDGVAVAEKDAARAGVLAALSGSALASRRIAVRINAVGSRWCHEDIIALATVDHPTLTLVVPKVESAADLGFVERLLLGLEAGRGQGHRLGLQCLIETAVGLANIDAIAVASERLESLIVGYADLASSLGRSSSGDWSVVQQKIVLAARANGLSAIDGPFFDLAGSAGDALEQACAIAAGFGFDGKWAIHPSQIETITASFTPSDDAIAHARAVVAKLDEARAGGSGVALLDGAMIDEAMRAGALRVLARAGVGP